VMLEWRGFGFEPGPATIGLGPEIALRSARREAVSAGELADWTRRSRDAPQVRPGAAAVVPPDAERFFRAEWLRPDPATTLEPAWSVLVAVAGAGRLATEDGELDLAAGDTVLVPYAAGAGELRGEVEAVRCLPPRSEEPS
jgi:mannose-6-phosphate isomerase